MLQFYKTEPLSVQKNLGTVLGHGVLAGTNKLVIYPVDHGFEHGPITSFSKNMEAMDPLYHFKLADETGMSALAAPVGFLSIAADVYCGRVPLILKLTNNTLFVPGGFLDQAETASVEDAVRLGCVGVGLTIYPGATTTLDMLERARAIIAEARENGLFTVVWCYPRGPEVLGKATAVDVIADAAHMAALLGAHIIKVKIPDQPVSLARHSNLGLKDATQRDRVKLVMQSAFNGKRLVIFSGGSFESEEAALDDVKAVIDGGGHGSIMGRNVFQRPWGESVELIKKVFALYQNAR
ncbi:MAG: class I fructose-bisphosphate aldolase [Alphaproteobacteria bacterium]|nr:class I fructose-bisphosphate aldolase [Alphaproteobacteria bacterium]